MHFKSLHNFLLIVLCTIGIGFASAPPAASQTITLDKADLTNGKGKAFFTATNGYIAKDVVLSGLDGDGDVTITTAQDQASTYKNNDVSSDYYVVDKKNGKYTIYYVPTIKVTNTGNWSCTKITFSRGGKSVYMLCLSKWDNTNSYSQGTFSVDNETLWMSSPADASVKSRDIKISPTRSLDGPATSFDSHSDEFTTAWVKNSDGTYKLTVTYTPKVGTNGTETVKMKVRMPGTSTNKEIGIKINYNPVASEGNVKFIDDAENTSDTHENIFATVENGATQAEISFKVLGTNTTGEPSVSFGSHASELTATSTQKTGSKYQINIVYKPTAYTNGYVDVPVTISMPGAKNTLSLVLKIKYEQPTVKGTINITSGTADATDGSKYVSLTAKTGIPEWVDKGRIVRELTIAGSGLTSNMTLSVSPQGNYGLTVSPTTLPAEGGKVTIIYKPKTGDKYYNPNDNNADEKKWPVLTIKADNAAAKTVQLRTTWDKTTVTQGVTPVPDIQPDDFDPVIYECKTFKGRNTVSLRWEPKNPKDIKLVEYTQEQIDKEADQTKKAWMQAWNEAYNNNVALKYTLYRDGKVIVSDLDITSYVDMNVPVGYHTYYVVARYINGRTASSAETTVKVERDMAVTTYVLEEVYNYPIVNQSTDNNISGVNTFNAYGTITGDDTNVQREGFLYKYNYPGDPNKGGSPGDGVRQAVFRDGHWYIAMVSNRYSNNGAIGYKTGANYNASERGHILKINADENIYQNPLKIYAELRTLSNQSLAMTEDAQYNFYFRGYNGNPGDLDNGMINLVNGDQYFKPMFSYGYKLGDGSVQYKANDIPEISSIERTTQSQYYRTHYMAARGKVADGKGKLCFAQNESHDAYIVDLDTDGSPKAYHKITAPRQAVTNYGGKQRIIDIIAGTENYIFPVEGEPYKYIHVMRSSGVFLVDVTDINNPIYTLISADLSEVRSASGMTFTLKNPKDGATEMFYIHGTSLYSNNPGHFRIDMAQRAKDASGNYTGDIHTANFSDMVPMASKLQGDIPGFVAGNSNGMWFGTEDGIEGGTEGGIPVKYIYQYVPGVRFAKYKFYPVQAFPPAQPTIDVVIRHDDPAKDNTPHEADDITHFDIAYSWKRPANFGTLQGAAKNFKIDGYNYELLDPNGNVLHKGYEAAKPGENDETVYTFYYNQHKPAQGDKLDFRNHTPESAKNDGIFDVHDGMYVIRVTPKYVSVNDRNLTYTGETGLAQDEANYTPEILNIRAKLWQASGKTDLYRVDIDFNRAPRHNGETSFAKPGDKEQEYTFYNGDGVAANHLLAEPASRFKLEVSKDNGTTWQAIDNLRVFYDGKILINPNNSTEKAEIKRINDNITAHKGEIHSGEHDGFIKHDYDFGGNFTSRSTRPGVKARAAAQPDTDGDKMYVQEAIAHLYGDVRTVDQNVLNAEKNNGAFQAVAYHMVDGETEDVSNIRNWKYRATALYADNQPYASIKRSASVETTLGAPIATGVEDAIADAAEGVHIWPVPAESELHIAAGEAIESVSIYNISGSCVASFKGNGDTTMTVSVDNLASGVYFVKVNANAARRLIKR